MNFQQKSTYNTTFLSFDERNRNLQNKFPETFSTNLQSPKRFLDNNKFFDLDFDNNSNNYDIRRSSVLQRTSRRKSSHGIIQINEKNENENLKSIFNFLEGKPNYSDNENENVDSDLNQNNNNNNGNGNDNDNGKGNEKRYSHSDIIMKKKHPQKIVKEFMIEENETKFAFNCNCQQNKSDEKLELNNSPLNSLFSKKYKKTNCCSNFESIDNVNNKTINKYQEFSDISEQQSKYKQNSQEDIKNNMILDLLALEEFKENQEQQKNIGNYNNNNTFNKKIEEQNIFIKNGESNEYIKNNDDLQTQKLSLNPSVKRSNDLLELVEEVNKNDKTNYCLGND